MSEVMESTVHNVVKWIVLNSICLASLLVASLPARATEPILVVATFNINYANANLSEIGKQIQESRADIVFLQETNRRSETFLRQHLGHVYPTMRFRGGDGRYFADRFGVLSQHPISDLKFTPPTAGLFGTLSGTVRWQTMEVRWFNIHFAPFTVPRHSGLAGVLKAAGRAEQQHQAEVAALLRRLDVSQPTIVAGDFNSLSTFVAPRMLRERGLIDSFAQCYDTPDALFTWKWPIRDPRFRLRIDYVFQTEHWKAVDCEVKANQSSDHSCVICKLQKAFNSVPSRQPSID